MHPIAAYLALHGFAPYVPHAMYGFSGANYRIKQQVKNYEHMLSNSSGRWTIETSFELATYTLVTWEEVQSNLPSQYEVEMLIVSVN